MDVLRFFWNVLRFLFSFRGRFSPLQFWAGQLCAIAIILSLILFPRLMGRPPFPATAPEYDVYFWVTITGFVVSLAAISKRLQHRGVPGRAIPGVIFLGLLIPVLLFAWAMDGGLSYWDSGGATNLLKFVASSLAMLASLLYIIVELGFRGPTEPEPPEPDDWDEDEEEDDETERLPVN